MIESRYPLLAICMNHWNMDPKAGGEGKMCGRQTGLTSESLFFMMFLPSWCFWRLKRPWIFAKITLHILLLWQ